MPWEKRGNQQYYYRARRVGRKVVREYFGRGCVARTAARQDEAARTARQEQRQAVQAVKDELAPLLAEMQELEAGVQLLMHAELLAAGYHQHRGNWRRRRERA